MRRTLFALRAVPAALAALLLASAPAAAQPDTAWNAPRALELIGRAQARRAETQADTGLVDYQADARGWVYFYLDRRDTGERTLVKTDQVALDVFWKAPNRSKQRIIGLRDEKRLPTSIHYHQDHLSVVQDNFGDLIRLGDGDEVRDVLHPAAPGAEAFYDYALADSTAIRLPGAGEPVHVYEVRVRPRDLSRPALVGSVFVDRRRGDIVRMAFTFTAASYVDRYLDYINVSLDNGLWRGRFWLPNRQQVEIRRQLPELGFPAGGMIRGSMQVSNYRFNQDLPASLFRGAKVVSVPEAQRRAFAFEQALYEELREDGIGPDTELAEIRRQAAELVRARVLSGLPALRADVPRASAVFRYNRAEGAAAGFGVRGHPTERTTLSLDAGWAFGAAHPVAEAGAARATPGLDLSAAGYWNRPRDVGVGPAASGVMNTFSALLAGEDYTDLYYARGGEVGLERALGAGPWTAGLSLRAEEHASARREADAALFGGEDDFRPVHPVDEGAFLGGALALRRGAPAETAAGWSAALGADGGVLRPDAEGGDLAFVRPTLELGAWRRWEPADLALELDLRAGAALGELPRQGLFLVGGRGTVPGFPFRAFGGDRFGVARATLSGDLLRPFVRGRLLASAGWTAVGEAGGDALSTWGAETTGRPRASVGAGVGLVFDILRLELHRGLGPRGRWETVVEVRPTFWDFL